MPYRSILRVFDGSNLERKILILSCFCLFLLIGASYFWVNRITEDLIKSDTAAKAHDQYIAYLLNVHVENMVKRPDISGHPVEEIASDMGGKNFEAEILSFGRGIRRHWTTPDPVGDEEIAKGLKELLPGAMERQKKNFSGSSQLEQTSSVDFGENEIDFKSIYRGDDYVYLKSIDFKPSCIGCHGVGDAKQQIEFADAALNEDLLVKVREQQENAEILFAKIRLPYRATQRAINRSRAILMTLRSRTS
ncbi:MAG: hypothetical protein AAGA30_07480, partial [Planctomycetota bacterium]